jgi:hypothetical protein
LAQYKPTTTATRTSTGTVVLGTWEYVVTSFEMLNGADTKVTFFLNNVAEGATQTFTNQVLVD